MSVRSDRSEPGGGWPIVVVMAVILVAAGAGGYYWFRVAGAPRPAATETTETLPAAPPARPDEPFPATLFVPGGDGRLAAVPAAVKRQPDVQLQAREAVAALLEDGHGGKAPVLKDLKLRALYLDAAGTAVVDLGLRSPAQKELRASVGDELLALYSLVNTLTQNIPEVRQVRIILDGREVQTLAGHIDLSRSFVKRTDLVKTP